MSVAGNKYTALTGGGVGALDAVAGTGLADGDIAIVMTGTAIYFYQLDADSGLTESSPTVIAPDIDAGTKRWILQQVPQTNTVPVGVVTAFIGGYFTSASNGGFTNVIGNSASAVNTLLNASGWYVCDGASLNLGTSSIFNGSGRYLPNLTDARFIMGYSSAGTVGGSSTNDHTHTGPSHSHSVSSETLTISQMPSHTHTYYTGIDGAGYAHPYADQVNPSGKTTGAQGGGGSHNHGGATGSSGTGNTGSASLTENRPQFLSALYIMKVA